MSISFVFLPQYLKNRALERSAQGPGLSMNGDWAGLQPEEPKLKVIWQTMFMSGTKIESQILSLDETTIQKGGRQSPIRGQQDENKNTRSCRSFKEEMGDGALRCFGYWNIAADTFYTESNSLAVKTADPS